MANDSIANPGSGGDTFNTTDLTTFTAVSLDAKLPGAMLFSSTGSGVKPAPIYLGQQLAAASIPIVLTAAQITTLTPPAAITGFALEAGHLANIDTHTPAAGQAPMAASSPVVIASNQTNLPMNIVQVGGATISQGHGTAAAAIRVELPTDGTGVLAGVTTVTTVTTVSTVTAVTAITNALPTGSNILGRVGIDQTTPGTTNKVSIGTDGVVAIGSAIPAGTNLLGRSSASNETSTIYNGTTALTPKFAKISAAASGDNTLVAGVGGKQIRVISLFLVAFGTANTVYFRENTAGTAIFGDATNGIPLDKTGAAGPAGLCLGKNEQGWMQSSTSNPLVLNLSAAQGVSGGLSYVEV